MLATVLSIGTAALAQTPGGTIKLIVPFPPGQGADTIMRLVAERLAPRLGQPVVIDNRPGAGGTVGTDFAAKQAPDGLTLLMGASGPMAISPTLQPSAARYNPLRDFETVTGVASVAQVFVVAAGSPHRSLQDLIRVAREQPEKIAYGSSGNGTTQHLFVEQFADLAGLRMLHVPYKGSAPALVDLIGGQVAMVSDTIPAMLPHIRAGKVRALGVTSEKRSPFLAEVPTIAEQGVRGYSAEGWITIVAPAGTPGPLADRLDGEIRKVLAEPDLRQKLADMGFVEMTVSRAALRNFIGAELAKWKKVIETAKIKVE
ncbi:MAG: Bug family tripartite tricarboxylate transporter substrate binding protein [Burkholderiales bacterium]